jgi:hypothetical protein
MILLKTKLNRLKISVEIQGNKIIIGKPRLDPVLFWGLIIAPIAAAILILYLLISSDYFSTKYIIFIIFLCGTSLFNFGRMGIKWGNNNSIKTLHNSSIKIGESKKFDNKNILDFICEVKEIKDDLYQGKLLLEDSDNNLHVLFGFDDVSEQFVMNDLKWFADFFNEYVK